MAGGESLDEWYVRKMKHERWTEGGCEENRSLGPCINPFQWYRGALPRPSKPLLRLVPLLFCFFLLHYCTALLFSLYSLCLLFLSFFLPCQYAASYLFLLFLFYLCICFLNFLSLWFLHLSSIHCLFSYSFSFVTSYHPLLTLTCPVYFILAFLIVSFLVPFLHAVSTQFSDNFIPEFHILFFHDIFEHGAFSDQLPESQLNSFWTHQHKSF